PAQLLEDRLVSSVVLRVEDYPAQLFEASAGSSLPEWMSLPDFVRGDPSLELAASEALSKEGAETDADRAKGSVLRHDANLSRAEVPMCYGVLGSIFGGASSFPSNEDIFHQPFDMELRATKILGDHLPIQSRAIRQAHALGLALTHDG
ncbi:hypothetical protein ACLOJK_006878, partial [Asimina triloba]